MIKRRSIGDFRSIDLKTKTKNGRPAWKREEFLCIDFADVDGIDVTGTLVFLQIAKSCANAGDLLLRSEINH